MNKLDVRIMFPWVYRKRELCVCPRRNPRWHHQHVRERETAKIDRVLAYLADVRLRDGPLRTSTWEANRVLGLKQRERWRPVRLEWQPDGTLCLTERIWIPFFNFRCANLSSHSPRKRENINFRLPFFTSGTSTFSLLRSMMNMPLPQIPLIHLMMTPHPWVWVQLSWAYVTY